MKSGPRFNKAEREVLKLKIADLMAQDKTEYEIADLLNITQQLVSYYWKQIRKEWREQRTASADEYFNKQLMEIRSIRREAWAAWEASKQAQEVTTTSKTEGTEGDGAGSLRAQVRRQTQTGDPRYLAVVQWCDEREAKLLGLDAPTKASVENTGAPNVIVEIVRGERKPDGGSTTTDHTTPD